MPPRQSDPPQAVPPLVTALNGVIRSAWEGLPGLEPLPVNTGLDRIEGVLDGEGLLISNELLRCRGVRKIHLELARLGRGLQILHCVWFPDPCFDLPIFGADIVAGPAGVSAAIVDLSPVSDALPASIDRALAALPRPPFRQSRDLPGWGPFFHLMCALSVQMGRMKRTFFNNMSPTFLRCSTRQYAMPAAKLGMRLLRSIVMKVS